MGPSWAGAFVVSLLLALGVTPLARRLALATDFVDRPRAHKSHGHAVPYLGGAGLIVAVLVASLFAPRPASELGVVAFGAAVLGTIGLLDDDRSLHPLVRFVAEAAVAGAVVLAGVRVHATGIVALDLVLTVVWIVGVTNAVNLLDNMDGLAAGVTAAAAGAIFAVAVLGGQRTTATLAAGLIGACLGFLAYNRAPASIFMGDAGSLFLGFVLAVLTIDVNPALDPPASFLVPLTLLALPVLDTTMVTVARLRRGLSAFQGGRDHLSHRLVARGLSRRRAVAALVVVEASVGALAATAARGAIALSGALLGAGVILAVVVAVTATAPVYDRRVVGLPRPLRLALAGLAIGVPLAAAPALVAVARAGEPARAGARATASALHALAGGDTAAAAASFQRASALLQVADGRLQAPLTSLGLAVPGVASNLRASRMLVTVGERLAATGSGMTAVAESRRLPVREGTVPVAELRRLAGELERASSILESSATDLRVSDRPYLLPHLRGAVRDLGDQVSAQVAAADTAAHVTRVLPALLGEGAPRRYLLAVGDNAELRATGGSVRSWGELVADGGRLRLASLHRVEEGEGWESANASPDFPTSARRMADLHARAGGPAVDGVVAVDVPGLAALLELSGPVSVPGVAEPVSAPTLLERGLPARNGTASGSGDDRARLLQDVAGATVDALTTADLGDPLRLASVLGPAVEGRHLLLFFERPEEAQLARDIGADGGVSELTGDSLMVVNQALAPTGTDTYLRRRIRYNVRVDPDDRPATLRGRLEVALENDAPPPSVDNQTRLSVYSPFPSHGAAVDGRPVELQTSTELGRHAHSVAITVPPQETRTLEVDLRGLVELGRDGWLSLALPHQALGVPDEVEVSFSVPPGWRIAEARGITRTGSRTAVARLRQGEDQELSLRLERRGLAGVWERLRGD